MSNAKSDLDGYEELKNNYENTVQQNTQLTSNIAQINDTYTKELKKNTQLSLELSKIKTRISTLESEKNDALQNLKRIDDVYQKTLDRV